MAHGGPVTIRPARPGDREWTLSLAPRLDDFGPPPRLGYRLDLVKMIKTLR